MPRRLKLVLVAGLFVLAASPTFYSASAWAQNSARQRQIEARPIPGPARALPTPRVHAVKPSPSHSNRVYSATPRGLFVSDDGGQAWVPLPVASTHEEVFSLAVHPADPGAVLVGRRDGLWHTRDGGGSWAPLGYPTPGPYIPLAIALSASQPNVIYMATARQGVFKSADGGSSWTSASTGLPEAAAGGRPEELRTLVVHPRNPDVAYIAHELHGVYRTTDGGASWQPFNQGLGLPLWQAIYPPRLAFDPDDPGRLYLVFGQRIHSHLIKNRLSVTSDAGEWLPVEVELPANTRFVGLSVDPRRRALHFWAQDAVWELPLPGTSRQRP
ncbi:MAG: hypothetical protein HY726_00220 [Candidatus Rokubacteria bacterium]|nr:hypothetical protein [Candidatus Rokubacteria bacterium]